MMGCSGTEFMLSDINVVWGRFMPSDRIPAQDAQDILDEVIADRAICFTSPDGLLVVTLTPGPTSVELFVLLAVSTGTPGAFRRQEAAVCAIARDLGASGIAFIPQRRGWAKLLGPDWSRRGDTFVRPIHGEEERRGPGDSPAACDGRAGANPAG